MTETTAADPITPAPDTAQTAFEQAVAELDQAVTAAAADDSASASPDGPVAYEHFAAVVDAARKIQAGARDYMAAVDALPPAPAGPDYTPGELTTPIGEQPAGNHPDTFAT